MNSLINKLNAVNMWFDRLPEPTRFILFMVVLMSATLPLQMGALFQIRLLAAYGIFMLCFLCGLAVLRVGKTKTTGAVAIVMIILGLLTSIVMLTHQAIH